eukprot:TRINITY_DN4529_c0_g1_i1.p1 TRINITY_DN4529_c0_g1~~TRINITY_DN4529_c0_g1_i1.p1  ORF type:complete len:210 (+),score=55.43 TRINITY_DN4529_c0_g1_i1:59-688(+)
MASRRAPSSAEVSEVSTVSATDRGAAATAPTGRGAPAVSSDVAPVVATDAGAAAVKSVMQAMKLVMKATVPTGRGAPVMKSAVKAKAPARGAPVMKAVLKAKAAKPKAIAYKPFAKVAAKASAKGETSPPGSGTWFFMKDLRKTKEGHDDPKAWQKFDAKMNACLEKAYVAKMAQWTMKFKDRVYIVKFKTMMQFRADDKSLQRPVKRE